MLGRFARFLASTIVGDEKPPDLPPTSAIADIEERFSRLESLLVAQAEVSQRIVSSSNSVLPLTGTPIQPYSSYASGSRSSTTFTAPTSISSSSVTVNSGPLSQGVAPTASQAAPIHAGSIASHLGLAKPSQSPPKSESVSQAAPARAPGGVIASHLGIAHPADDFTSHHPQGRFQRSAPLSSPTEVQGLSYNRWAWRSIGNRSHFGLLAEVRRCLGVFECTNTACGRVVRPRTQPGSRLQQLAKNCVLCGSPLRQITCDARTFRYTTTLNDVPVMVWEHDGFHFHAQPPPPSTLSRQERAMLDEQVLRNPNASAHQLRTGNLVPGSIPLHRISETLANPAAARYQVAQSMSRQGIPTAASQKGGFSLLSALAQLNEDERFIVDASLTGPVYISFQTSFMEQALNDTMEDWVSEDSRAEERHGIVTDSSMKFFREGELLTSSVFSAVTLSWIPGLLTLIMGRDTDHHIPHFDRIGKQIVSKMGTKFDRKHLLHVMDFSLAQRKAHAIAYANACVEALGPFYKQLDKAVQERQYDLLVHEAESMEIGCEVHFERSLLRVRKTGAIVNPNLSSRFENLIRILRGRNTTIVEFNDAKEALLSEFPRLKSWITWWMDQPSIASMIFPAKSSVDHEIRDQVPSTSNPVEHQHSLLNHASGTHHELLPGVKLLLKHVQELEAQYKAIKQGVYDPMPPRQPKRPPPPKPFDNDGRAPDTLDTLNQPLIISPFSLIAYKWIPPNSCFMDAPQELWYRAQLQMSPARRQGLLLLFPSGSFLSGLFHHFMRRARVVEQYHDVTSPESLRKMVQELDLGQTLTKQHVFDVWRVSPKNDYGCAITWLQHAVRDKTGSAAQGAFGIQHLVVSRCAAGHISSTYSPSEPTVVHTIEESAATALQRHYGADTEVTAEHYFQHYVPRDRANGNNPVHTHPTSRRCTHTGCSLPSHVQEIMVSLPQILNCRPQIVTNPSDDCLYPVNLKWPRTITIEDVEGKGNVTYKLVGWVNHSVNHFTTCVWQNDELYMYNDMDGSDAGYATLKPFDAKSLTSSDIPFLYVYVQLTTPLCHMTHRPAEFSVAHL